MANLDEIVQKTAETAEAIAGRSAVIVKKAADGAKTVMRVGKLKMDIAAERDGMRRNFALLGRQYYELKKEEPDTEFETTVREITAAEERIAAMREELRELKADDEDTDDDIDGDYGIDIEITVEKEKKDDPEDEDDTSEEE